MKIIRCGRPASLHITHAPRSLAALATLLCLGSLAPLPARLEAQTTAAPAAAATPAKPVVSAQPPAPPAITVRPAGSPAPVTVPAPTAAPAKAKPGGEGMMVHGHWIIEVKNPDGTTAEKRDFENALLAPTVLLQLLAGQITAGDMALSADDTAGQVAGTQFCTTSGITGYNCFLAVSTTGGLGAFNCPALGSLCIPGLTYAVNNSSGLITLSGTMPVAQSATISSVYTFLFSCAYQGSTGFSNVAPQQCYVLNPSQALAFNIIPTTTGLTGASITPVNVTAGQTVLFTVTLTFS